MNIIKANCHIFCNFFVKDNFYLFTFCIHLSQKESFLRAYMKIYLLKNISSNNNHWSNVPKSQKSCNKYQNNLRLQQIWKFATGFFFSCKFVLHRNRRFFVCIYCKLFHFFFCINYLPFFSKLILSVIHFFSLIFTCMYI